MLNFIRGFCMALADSVPGVSGGTVAFLLGFYDKFIMSLDYLMSGTKEERIEAIKFLIRIGIGWVVGMGAAVSVLASIFDDRIYEISSLFLGLIIFAIPMICKEEKDSLKGKYQNIIWAVIGVVLVAAITYFNPVSGKGISVSVEHLNIALVVYIFAVAMVAISAMVLPGISGSTMLLWVICSSDHSTQRSDASSFVLLPSHSDLWTWSFDRNRTRDQTDPPCIGEP